MKNKVILAILDGFGIGENSYFKNAIYAANTKFFDKYFNEKYMAKLAASEEPVGLNKNQFGNSELGHMTIGTGQTILGINQIFNKLVFNNKLEENLLKKDWFKNIIEKVKRVHLCGMFSNGQVHSNVNHFYEIIRIFNKYNVEIFLHLITDGRDTKPRIILDELYNLQGYGFDNVRIATIGGRYYGMDRDNNFERTQFYYDAMIQNNITEQDVKSYIQNQYELNIDDEFITPVGFINSSNIFNEDDTIIFLNYRADRIRQIIHLFKQNEIFEYKNKNIKLQNIIGLCQYPNCPLDDVIVLDQKITQTLSKTLSENDISQLHIAETEKYAHVTYFFNAGNDIIYNKQKNILIPSIKVKTYDLKPEMSAHEITSTITNEFENYDFIVVNFANADMVGHTGNFEATKKAIEILDKQCELLYNLVCRYDGTLLITSDHGNADEMIDDDNNIVKTHTIAKVPFIVLSNNYKINKLDGRLQDIAPSVLYLFDISIPNEMHGQNLLTKK